MSQQKAQDDDWVLLSKLKQLIISNAAAASASSQVDGRKESCGPVAGNSPASAGAVQKDEKPGKTDGVPEPVPTSPSSSPVQQSCSTDEPVPNQQLQPVVRTANPLLSLSSTAADAYVLRGRLAQSLRGIEGGFGLVKRKHHYQYGEFVCTSPANTGGGTAPNYGAIGLCKIPQGDTYASRLGNAVRIHSITQRIVHERAVVKQSAAVKTPLRQEIFLVDKIPVDLNKAPTLFEKGTDPPEGNLNGSPFNCLGIDPADAKNPAFSSVSVRNPIDAPLWDLFGHHTLNYDGHQGLTYLTTLSADSTGAGPPIAIRHERVHKMDLICVYEDTTTQFPMINNLWWYCWTDQPANSQSSEEYEVSFDIEFSDVNL